MKSSILVISLCLPVLIAGCASLESSWVEHTTVPDVERRIDSALPIGSTKEEIEAWLTGQGIEHSFTDRLHLTDTTAQIGNQWPPSTKYSGMIDGIIRNTDRSLFVQGNITLIFLLGNDGKLCERKVKWVGTGP